MAWSRDRVVRRNCEQLRLLMNLAGNLGKYAATYLSHYVIMIPSETIRADTRRKESSNVRRMEAKESGVVDVDQFV
jgi:hypothetical protein